MSKRLIATTLIATSALSAVANAQTAGNAPANAPAAKPATQAAAPAATPAKAPAQNIGTITAAEPEPQRTYAQPGMTAAPTDMNQNAAPKTSKEKTLTPENVGVGNAPSTGVTPGGVNRVELGGGYMIQEQAKKTRSTVTRDAIDKLSPTANPYQMINLLPGTVVSSTDNTGLNGGNIRMRSLHSDHLGLTIEGMPVNDSGNYALYPQEYADGPNISHISIAQGYQELDSPHIGSAGGVINVYMRDPAKTAGGFASYSLASNNLRRQFLRLESGEVGKFSAYLSYSHLTKNHWAGPGSDERTHVDFKAKWGDKDNTIRFAAIYNHAVNNFYANPKMSDFKTPGWKPGYLPELPSSFFTPDKNGNIDQGKNSAWNYYKYRVNPFDNLILSAPSNFKISETVKFDTVPYFWYGFGSGGGTTTMDEKGMWWGNMKITGVNYGGSGALGDKILYYNPSITETYRPGVINKFTFDLGNHKIIAGHWFEYARHKQTGPYMPLNADGSIDDVFARGSHFSLPASAQCKIGGTTAVACPQGPMQKRDQLTVTTTNAVFLGDSWKINDKFTLDAGVRQLWLHREVDNNLPFAVDAKGVLDETKTLPQIGLSYQANKENKFFGSYGTSFRSAPNYTLVSSYDTGKGTLTPAAPIPPEHGHVIEAGHRYQGALFATSITGFFGYYENFQQSTKVLDKKTGSNDLVTETINAGRIMNYGIDAEFGMRPVYNFRPYVSAELLRTRLLDDMFAGGKLGNGNINDYLATTGKEMPGAPRFQLAMGLDYDNGHWFANTQFKYIGAQYSTFMNDEKMDAHSRIDASVGYHFSDVGYLKKPEIKLNLFNLANARQLTGVNGVTTNAQDTKGLNGSTVKGAAPTYYLGQGFSAMLTFSAGF